METVRLLLDYPPPEDERDPREARYCVFCLHYTNKVLCGQCLDQDLRGRPEFEWDGKGAVNG